MSNAKEGHCNMNREATWRGRGSSHGRKLKGKWSNYRLKRTPDITTWRALQQEFYNDVGFPLEIQDQGDELNMIKMKEGWYQYQGYQWRRTWVGMKNTLRSMQAQGQGHLRKIIPKMMEMMKNNDGDDAIWEYEPNQSKAWWCLVSRDISRDSNTFLW